MSRTSAKNVLKKMDEVLKKSYGRPRPGRKQPILDLLITQVLGPDLPPATVEAAAQKLVKNYIDWNEVRVSNRHEIAGHLAKAGLDRPVERATQLKLLLQDVFQLERKYTFDVLNDMTPDRVKKFFANFKALDAAGSAVVISIGMGVTSTPVTPGMLRVLKRIGLIQSSDTMQRAQKFLDEQLTPDTMFPFYRGLTQFADTVCMQDGYDCFACGMKKFCKTGAKAKKPAPPAKRAPKKKK